MVNHKKIGDEAPLQAAVKPANVARAEIKPCTSDEQSQLAPN